MRIGLVCYAYPPQSGTGGVGTYMFRLAGALGRAGHEVHVICGPSDRPGIAQPNVAVHRVPARFDLASPYRAVRWLYWHTLAPAMARAHPILWHLMRWNIASEAAIREVDRLHPLNVIESPEFAGNAWMAGRIHRWPIVLRMHCPWELFVRINRMRFNPMHRVMAYFERKTVSDYADAITAPSLAMKRQAEKSWRLRRPIRVIPNFMDIPPAPAPLPAEDGPQRIVCIGRIERLKGQDTLVRAFAQVAPRHRRAELWLIGPDSWGGPRPFAAMLDHLVTDSAIRRRIHLTGALALSDCEAHLRTARVAVVPSIGFESFSLSALEAMAAARPIIAGSAGALPEVLDQGRAGLLTRPGDADDLAGAMDRLLGDRDLSEHYALAAHQTARDRFDTPRVLPRMIEAYQEAADFFYGVHRPSRPDPHSACRRP